MRYQLSDKLQRILSKLYKKDKKSYLAVESKISEIVNSENPDHYKNLSYDLSDFKGVHIGHFVLVFYIQDNVIYFENYEHHDRVYAR